MNRIIIKEAVSAGHCPIADPGTTTAASATEVLEVFSQRVLKMAKTHGDSRIADSVRLVVPDGRAGIMGWDELFDYLVDRLSPEGANDLETTLSEEVSLDEQAQFLPALGRGAAALGRGALNLGKSAVGKVKNLFKKNPAKTGAGAGTAAATGAGSGFLGTAAGTLTGAGLGSMVDKDVNIADISTQDELGVKIARGSAPWLEALIGQTNELLQQMVALLGQSQPALSQGLKKLDVSIDDLISSETGESTSAVQTRQGLGVRPDRPFRIGDTRTREEKPSKKTKDKEEKTKSK